MYFDFKIGTRQKKNESPLKVLTVDANFRLKNVSEI